MVRIAGEVGTSEQGEGFEITNNQNHPANVQRPFLSTSIFAIIVSEGVSYNTS